MKILVVDDEKGFVQMIHDALSPRGFEVIRAHNGEEALKALEGITPPGLLILDVNMPVMSGIEFYNRLSRGKRRSPIPTLVVTARSQMEEMFRDIGADGFLSKPFALQDLFSEVDSIIGRRVAETARKDRPRRILLAENDASAAYEIMSLFSEAGYELLFAPTGFQAVEKAADSEPDALLIKLNLDDMGGDETACKIRQFHSLKDTPLILYSTDSRGYDPLVLKKIVDKAGVSDVFHVSRPHDLLAETDRLILRTPSRD
jgi:CheY-like chemotaxis protein